MRCVDLNRRRRRQLTWCLAGFVAIQLGMAVGVERAWPAVRDPEFTARRELYESRRAEACGRRVVLALGSSRTLQGLDASRLSGNDMVVFNFGMPGGGAMTQAVCLRRLFAEGLRPDLVLIEVVPMGLHIEGDRPLEETQLDPARLRGEELARLRPYYARLDRAVRRWSLARLLPCYRHQAEFRARLGLDQPREAPTGPVALGPHGQQLFHDGSSPETRASRVRRALTQYGPITHDYRLAAGAVSAYRDLLALCREQGLAVALVVMPEGSAFRARYSPEAWVGIDAFVRGLAAEYGVPAFDAREWIGDDGFWDGHHLNTRGAEAFTERFGREALEPLLATR